MGSKRFDNLVDLGRNGGDLQITCRNPRCKAQLVVHPWLVTQKLRRMRDPLMSTSFEQISIRLRCQWCGEKHPDVRATMKTR